MSYPFLDPRHYETGGQGRLSGNLNAAQIYLHFPLDPQSGKS
jgi:hypothetical protein